MLPFVLALIATARVFFQSRTDIDVEGLALRYCQAGQSSVDIELDLGCTGSGNLGCVAAGRGSPRKFAS
jgi:hypothetical protein